VTKQFVEKQNVPTYQQANFPTKNPRIRLIAYSKLRSIAPRAFSHRLTEVDFGFGVLGCPASNR